VQGGEKTRLSIARLLSRNHNMLILDEPTTYLDVMSQRILLLPENLVVAWAEDLFFEVTRI